MSAANHTSKPNRKPTKSNEKTPQMRYAKNIQIQQQNSRSKPPEPQPFPRLKIVISINDKNTQWLYLNTDKNAQRKHTQSLSTHTAQSTKKKNNIRDRSDERPKSNWIQPSPFDCSRTNNRHKEKA